MTLATLQSKREALLLQKEQTFANLNALAGAIQIVEDMIAEESKPADESAADAAGKREARS